MHHASCTMHYCTDDINKHLHGTIPDLKAFRLLLVAVFELVTSLPNNNTVHVNTIIVNKVVNTILFVVSIAMVCCSTCLSLIII